MLSDRFTQLPKSIGLRILEKTNDASTLHKLFFTCKWINGLLVKNRKTLTHLVGHVKVIGNVVSYRNDLVALDSEEGTNSQEIQLPESLRTLKGKLFADLQCSDNGSNNLMISFSIPIKFHYQWNSLLELSESFDTNRISFVQVTLPNPPNKHKESARTALEHLRPKQLILDCRSSGNFCKYNNDNRPWFGTCNDLFVLETFNIEKALCSRHLLQMESVSPMTYNYGPGTTLYGYLSDFHHAAINMDVLSSVGENVIVELSAVTIGGWFLGHMIDSYFSNPLGWMVKWTIYGAVATGLYLWFFTNFFEEHRVERENTGTYMHWVIRWYTALPWNVLSRFYGYYSKIPIPRPLRRLVYGRYAKIHNANMDEAEKPYEAYPTFGKWFNRNLKPGIRPISDAPLVSPADGIIIHYGQVEDGDKIVYVKGQDFSVEEFLGPIKVHRKKDKRLYQVCVFLTSGSYHNFHSPTKWTLKEIFHHPGDLFKVRPGYINYIPRVFCVNERVSICGEWEHGFMSLTPVAATYVGDIVIDVENPSHPILEHGNMTVPYKEYHMNHKLKPGEKIGQFRSGSVNVLIFEGPPDMKFAIKPGQKINYGQPIVELTD